MAGDAYQGVGMSASYWLSQNLEKTFSIHGEAHDWLMSLWGVIQVFDDMADGDFPDREDLLAAISDALVLMPANPFFKQNAEILLPLVAVAILKWKASDDVEKEGEPSEMSFAWRAGFYDIVLAVVQIVHGREVAMDAARYVMSLYGEDYKEYQKEFSDA